jgi:hypothetical protein
MTDQEVRQLIGSSMMQRMLLTPVATNARVPVGFATPYASMLLEARQGEFAAVPTAAFRAGLNPTDADLQRFYAANRNKKSIVLDLRGNGGGLFVGGSTSGVDSASMLFIVGNTANGSNQADAGGGGIYDDIGGTGSIAFSDIMVVGNHAPNMSGGGIYENSFGGLTPKSSYKNLTVSGNDAQFAGGGFYVAGALTSLTNATITGNSTTGQVGPFNVGGGGIAGGQSGSVTVNNATINGNTSTTQGGGVAAIDRGDHIHLHNTIVVKNTVLASSSDCFVGGFGTAIDSTGYNIVDDNTCALVPATDRQGSSFNPNLGALQDNTGPLDGAPGNTSPTLTEALPTGSSAIDTADPAGANNPATDERGVSRPQGTQSDVGAYEAIPPVFVAPILPAAGNAGSGSQSSTFWLLLILAAATALGAVGLRVRARS